jgi:hypothetical protein
MVMTRPDVTAGPMDLARRPANGSFDPACPSNRPAETTQQSSPIPIARFVAIKIHQFTDRVCTNSPIALGFY